MLAACQAGHSTEASGPPLEGVCDLGAGCVVALRSGGDGYECRTPRERCERGFLERGCSRVACVSQTDCVFEPGHCFCPPGVTCVCGGGPPPGCRPAKTDR